MISYVYICVCKGGSSRGPRVSSGKVLNPTPLARHEADRLFLGMERVGAKVRLTASHERSAKGASLEGNQPHTISAHYALSVVERHSDAEVDRRVPLMPAEESSRGVALHGMCVALSGAIFTASDGPQPLRMWKWKEGCGGLKMIRWFNCGFYLPSLDKRVASLAISSGPPRKRRTLLHSSCSLTESLGKDPGTKPLHACSLCVEEEEEAGTSQGEEDENLDWEASLVLL